VDSTLLSDPTTVWSYPNSITTIDMQGTVKTLLTTDAGTGPVTLVADADSIYFEACTVWKSEEVQDLELQRDDGACRPGALQRPRRRPKGNRYLFMARDIQPGFSRTG
jgi:hypothetical protein